MNASTMGRSPPYPQPTTVAQAKANLNYYINRSKIKRTEIAKHCGLGASVVSRWGGVASPKHIPYKWVKTVAELINADPNDLVTDRDLLARILAMGDDDVFDDEKNEVVHLSTDPKTSTEYKNNLRFFRVKRGMAQLELAHKLSLTQSYISIWEDPKTPNFPNHEQLCTIAMLLDTELHLLGPTSAARHLLETAGTDERLKRIAIHAQNVLDVIQSDSDRIYDASSNVDRISLLAENDPLLNLKSNVCVSAGEDMPYEMQFNATLGEMVGIKGGKGFAIAHVCGDSMFNPITGKGIPDGSVVLVDTSKRDPKLLVGKIVCFMRDGGCLIKRLRDNHGTLNAVSDNPRYFPIFFGQHEVIELLGEVVKVITDVE